MRDVHCCLSSINVPCFRPEGAPTNQPRATPWESSPACLASPERASQGEAPLCFALSGLGSLHPRDLGQRSRWSLCPRLVCGCPFGAESSHSRIGDHTTESQSDSRTLTIEANAVEAPAATPPSAPSPSNGSASSSACGKTGSPTTIKLTPKPSPKPKAPSPNSSPTPLHKIRRSPNM